MHACSNTKTIRPGDTLEVAFNKAMSIYKKGKYAQAANAFQSVISIGRGTEAGRRAQYLLAETYFKAGEYLMAASEYNRYTSLYPQAKNGQRAEFRRALSYYKLSPDYNLSQKHTRKAIDLFELFISRYPESGRVQDSKNYIDELRSKLAHKMFNSAKLYQRIDEYEAAAIYYGLTTENYPETAWGEKAQVNQIFAYIQFARHSVASQKDDRYKKAINSYEQYVQLFPQGEHRELAEKYLNTAETELSKMSPAPKKNNRETPVKKRNPKKRNTDRINR